MLFSGTTPLTIERGYTCVCCPMTVPGFLVVCCHQRHPADWQYQETTDRLLFQLDPLADNEMDLFSLLDGFLYFFFEGDDRDFSKVKLVEDIS